MEPWSTQRWLVLLIHLASIDNTAFGSNLNHSAFVWGNYRTVSLRKANSKPLIPSLFNYVRRPRAFLSSAGLETLCLVIVNLRAYLLTMEKMTWYLWHSLHSKLFLDIASTFYFFCLQSKTRFYLPSPEATRASSLGVPSQHHAHASWPPHGHYQNLCHALKSLIAYSAIRLKLLSRLGYPSNKLRSSSLGEGATSEDAWEWRVETNRDILAKNNESQMDNTFLFCLNKCPR